MKPYQTYCVVIEFLSWNSCGCHIHWDYPVGWKPLVCSIESLSLCIHWHGPGTAKSYVSCMNSCWFCDLCSPCSPTLICSNTSMMYFQCFLKTSPNCPGHYTPMDAIGFTPGALSTAGHFLFTHWILHEPVPCESCHQGWGCESGDQVSCHETFSPWAVQAFCFSAAIFALSAEVREEFAPLAVEMMCLVWSGAEWCWSRCSCSLQAIWFTKAMWQQWVFFTSVHWTLQFA